MSDQTRQTRSKRVRLGSSSLVASSGGRSSRNLQTRRAMRNGSDPAARRAEERKMIDMRQGRGLRAEGRVIQKPTPPEAGRPSGARGRNGFQRTDRRRRARPVPEELRPKGPAVRRKRLTAETQRRRERFLVFPPWPSVVLCGDSFASRASLSFQTSRPTLADRPASGGLWGPFGPERPASGSPLDGRLLSVRLCLAGDAPGQAERGSG